MAANKPKPIPNLSIGDIARFWSKVDKRNHNECWPWKGSCRPGGYGQLTVFVNGIARCILAHRISWALSFGDSGNLLVCHRCDNPPCCNPAHFFLGTGADNNADKVSKGRVPTGDRSGTRIHPERLSRGDKHWTRVHPELLKRGDNHPSRTKPETRPRGESHAHTKLTNEQVLTIRSLSQSGIRNRVLARQFNVSEATMSSIIKRQVWKHI